jgi:PAS domain S-box-containing protein
MNVAVVGAGQGGTQVIRTLMDYEDLHILCVVDKNPLASGIQLAKQSDIYTTGDIGEIFSLAFSHVDIILEVTGDPEVYQQLSAYAPNTVTVISGNALRFFLRLMSEKERLISELETRQRDLELVLNSTHDGMIGINADGYVTLFNSAAKRLTGISIQNALGRRVEEVISDSKLRRVAIHGSAELNQVQTINGTEIVTNRMPVYNESGEIIGAIAVFRDVTELRQLAVQVTNLKEVQQLLEAVIQSTQDAISVVDKHGVGILINPAYTRLTGLPPEQVIGQPAEVDIAEGDSMHMRVLRTGEPVKNVPMKVGPARKEVIVNVAPILVGGELRGSVGVIHDISEIKHLTEELARAKQLIRTMSAKYTFSDIVGRSQNMILAIEQAKKAAQTPATVLLRGESGTGKELFAHAIHNESDRKHRPFVRVNCAALSESLLESELFGYEEGAFTGARRGGRRGLFEEASGGTLFLDEIGEINFATQVKLLRAIQEREIVRVGGTEPIPIDVRLIAATHVNLEQAVVKGEFREDLYYRLNVIPIVIPPLRYRKEDIEAIATTIVYRHNQLYGRNVERIDQNAIALLERYDWPGNVRELENAIGRAMIRMAYGETVMLASHIPVLAVSPAHIDPTPEAAPADFDKPVERLQDIVRNAEKNALVRALTVCKGNKTEAARRLGISVRSLYYKLTELQIES